MVKAAFLTLVVAAILIQVWRRLSATAKARLQAKVSDMIRSIGRMAQALKNRAFRRRYAYQAMFLEESGRLNDFGQVVIADLTKFCRGLNTIAFTQTGDGHTDLFRTVVAEGRREVLLHIMKELKLDLNALLDNARAEDDAIAA